MFNFTAPATDQTSYGSITYNLLDSLRNLGVVPTFWPIGGVGPVPGNEDKYRVALSEATKRQKENWYFQDSLRLFHAFDLAQHVGDGLQVNFPIFELNKFTEREKYHLECSDKIIVCSEWAKDTVLENGVEPIGGIHVVPLGVDPSNYFPQKNGRLLHGPTNFVNIGKWEIRKGHDILHNAFAAAFSPNDNVSLTMVPTNYFIGQQGNETWIKYFQQSLGSRVRFRGEVVNESRPTTNEMVNLLRSSDCFISTSRAEGWNMGCLEALSVGCHVISTYHTGETEYLTEQNARLIPFANTELARDGMWFTEESNSEGHWGQWGEDEFDLLVEHMRSIHRRKQMGQLGINAAGIETGRIYTWENSARRLLEALNLKV